MTKTISMPLSFAPSKEAGQITFELSDLPYIFIAGGFVGTVYEFLLTLITKGLLEDRTGSILTPFNYIYGIGAIVMFLALYRLKNPVTIFAFGCVIGGIVEFGLSLGQEMIFGTVSWDYSQKMLNIGGRTTLPYMLVWGLLCLIAVKVVFPLLLNLIHKIPEQARRTGAYIILALMLTDIAVTFTASIRYTQRSDGIVTQNPVMHAVDRVFDDSFMTTHFPNTKIC